MSTITKEFTKEQLIEQAKKNIEVLRGAVEKIPGASDAAVIHLKLAEITLASLEAEAVGYMNRFTGRVFTLEEQPGADTDVQVYMPVYTAPQAPVSVPDLKPVGFLFVSDDGAVAYSPADWPMKGFNLIGQIYGDVNACSAAMLQGAEPVTTAYKLPEGWVAVPVEPTEDMIVQGFESEPDESFSDEREWEAYDAMSGCQQAAHRAKLCWAAMIASAPKPEA